jgi:hypothetical protein
LLSALRGLSGLAGPLGHLHVGCISDAPCLQPHIFHKQASLQVPQVSHALGKCPANRSSAERVRRCVCDRTYLASSAQGLLVSADLASFLWLSGSLSMLLGSCRAVSGSVFLCPYRRYRVCVSTPCHCRQKLFSNAEANLMVSLKFGRALVFLRIWGWGSVKAQSCVRGLEVDAPRAGSFDLKLHGAP